MSERHAGFVAYFAKDGFDVCAQEHDWTFGGVCILALGHDDMAWLEGLQPVAALHERMLATGEDPATARRVAVLLKAIGEGR